MDEIIKKIIAIEKKADKLVDDAKKLNENVEAEAGKEVNPEIEKINDNIKVQLDELYKESEKRVEARKNELKDICEQAKKDMYEKYEKDHEKWVKLIFEHIFA